MARYCQLARISKEIALDEFLKAIALIIRGWIKERNAAKAAKVAHDIAANLSNGGRVRESEFTTSDLASGSKRDSDE